MAIQKIAKGRGITPMVREPLNQSSAIDNPQRSQAMSQAMGMPGDGFGTSPLDANRVSIVPQGQTRRSDMSQEASDEATAFSNALTGSGDQDRINLANTASGFSLATLRGQERQREIEGASEALASRLEALRQRATRIKSPLAEPVIGEDILTRLYAEKGRRAGDQVLFTPETIQELNPLQVLLSINNAVQTLPNGTKTLMDALKRYNFGTPQKPSLTVFKDLKEVAVSVNRGEQNVRIPFVSSNMAIPVAKLVELLNDIKSGGGNIRAKIEQGRARLMGMEKAPEAEPTEEPGVPARPRPGGLELLIRAPNPEVPAPRPGFLERLLRRKRPGAGQTVAAAPDAPPAQVAGEGLSIDDLNRMTNKELRDLLQMRGLKVSFKNKSEAVSRLVRA
jgi:hypothetical protein